MNVRSVDSLTPTERRELFDRDAGVEAVRDDVRGIVERVRTEGDVALREFAEEFDGVSVGNIDVTDRAERAFEGLDEERRTAIETAAGNVERFHERQVPEDWLADAGGGRELGRRFAPVESAGVYAPGGTAAYPSSVLMGVVPATCAAASVAAGRSSAGGVATATCSTPATVAGTTPMRTLEG